MKEYKLQIEITAEQDLLDILAYISHILKEPKTANRIYKAIKENILTLSTMPDRHMVVEDEPYASVGLRRLFVENYIVFYVIKEAEQTVHIIRVLYNRRDWQNLL